MKTGQKLAAILAAAFFLSGSVPVWAAQTDRRPEETVAERENSKRDSENTEVHDALSETATLSGNEIPHSTPKAPPFYARLEYRMDYTVIGTFTDFTPDIIQILTLYSLDGENWTDTANDWNLYNLCTDDESKLQGLQNQPCLFAGQEPLKSYIAGKTDRFYVKLRITRENGLSYETQTAIIERGGLRPVPEDTERTAWFSSALAVHEPDPSSPDGYVGYGKYQVTIPADATAEEVAALLPDTLPVTVYLDHKPDFLAIGTVDCPVAWKPLSLPRLTAGESITISDAAEEIFVPAGTVISTPMGIFRLEEPLPLNLPPTTDEVRLVLNVGPEDRTPTGVLRERINGLEMAFHLKPTGATAIRTYVLTEEEEKWTELSGLSLSEVLSQPSTANSGYGLVLQKDQEPYRSYLAAINAGETPTPFFIGLKIEGGIYDGQQLILPWPDTYEELPYLPKFGGAGGNEGNAGADNRGDSTEGGQRPDLPQAPDEKQEEPQTPAPEEDGQEQQKHQALEDNLEKHPADQTPERNLEEHPADQTPERNLEEHPADQAPERNLEEHPADQTPESSRQKQEMSPARTKSPAFAVPGDQSIPSKDQVVSNNQSERRENPPASGQRSNLPQITPDTDNVSAARQGNGLASDPLMAYAAAADAEDEKNSLPPPGEKTADQQRTEHSRRIPFLPVAAAAAAGCCIGVAVCKAAGYDRLRRIAGKILLLLHIHI